jgi:polysaccharide export outer membrane protein
MIPFTSEIDSQGRVFLLNQKKEAVMDLRRFWILAVLVIGLITMSQGNSLAQQKETETQTFVIVPQEGHPRAVPSLIGEGGTYTIGKGDIIQIIVMNQPEFSGNFSVGPDGNIQYNFVGDIKAEGLTKEQLKEALINALQAYVKLPQISVAITDYRSKFVYVLGEVGNPGKYPMMGDTVSLRDALMAASLPTQDAALRRTYVIKPDLEKPVYTKVDLVKVLYDGVLKDNLTLTPGDIVFVPSTMPSELNRALTTLLSPITRAAAVGFLIDRATD